MRPGHPGCGDHAAGRHAADPDSHGIGSQGLDCVRDQFIEFLEHHPDHIEDMFGGLEFRVVPVAMPGQIRGYDGNATSHEAKEATRVDPLPRRATVEPENRWRCHSSIVPGRVQEQGRSGSWAKFFNSTTLQQGLWKGSKSILGWWCVDLAFIGLSARVPSHPAAGIDGSGCRYDPAFMPRIIAGTYRSRMLESVQSLTTRPYTDRVKESVFNILQGHIEGSNILDLFSGVGTMGLESISRGAAQVVCVEQDAKVHAVLQRNIELLGCEVSAEAVRGDALSSTPILRAPRPVHVIFMDPPFAMMKDDRLRARVLEQVGRVAELLDEHGWLVLRTPLSTDHVDHEVEGLEGPEVRTYKKEHHVLFYAKGGGASS